MPHIKLWVIGAGFPCEGLSALNANLLSFEDPRPLLCREVVRVVDLREAESSTPVAWFCENVASMDRACVQHFNQEFGGQADQDVPLRLDARTQAPALWEQLATRKLR